MQTIKIKSLIAEKIYSIAIDSYFSSNRILKGLNRCILKLLVSLYPSRKKPYDFFNNISSYEYKWVNEVENMIVSLPVDKKRKYISNFIGVFLRNKLQREEQLKNNKFQIPVIMILSLTQKCNLKCKGCYASRFREDAEVFDLDKISEIITKSSTIGITNYLLVGGEPLMFKGLIEIPKRFPRQIFFIFTNSTLVSHSFIDDLEKLTNVFLVLSTDINADLLDEYRGCTTYGSVKKLEEELIVRNIPYGKSIIVSQKNYKYLMDNTIRNSLFTSMCRAAVFLKYVGNEKDRILTREQIIEFNKSINYERKIGNGYILNFPEDEFKYFDKCGKAETIIHVAPDGNVEPCPFDKSSLGNILQEDILDILQKKITKDVKKCGSVCSGEFS
jgi:MoaA/NifB/PqqE/SkfB family radical SAM enzyme